MEKIFSKTTINTHNPIFPYNTWTPRINKDEPKTQTRYYHPNLKKEIDDFACDACHKMKQPGPGYGILPEQDVGIVPWAEVTVDLLGP